MVNAMVIDDIRNAFDDFDIDKYWFVIENEKDGETVKYGFEVTKEEYEKYKIGDFYER